MVHVNISTVVLAKALRKARLSNPADWTSSDLLELENVLGHLTHNPPAISQVVTIEIRDKNGK